MDQNLEKKQYNLDYIISKIITIVTILGVVALVVFISVSLFFLAPIDSDEESLVDFQVKEGVSKIQIAEELDKAGLIRNAFFFKFYMKINEHEIYPGTYQLSKSMSVDEIIKILNSGNSLENQTITITFIEGKRFISYVKQISETFDIFESDILAKLSNEEYLTSLIDKYWFLNESILNKDIKYPLEGYLFPDTYIIKKSATIEDIINLMLTTMDHKLSIYKDEINLSSYKINELITLASIIELEGANSLDRAGVAGVFYNRLKSGWTLGSDVTTYYAVDKTFDVDLSINDINSCNSYNTRGTCVLGLPIGPIASPSLASISAVIEPTEHEYFYFVADKLKNTYYSKTDAEHRDIINKLKKEGNWFEY
ncbi:MAG: endolytic transglycosylase MltG [Bacilli bacterium]|nr:endolytic transglycosylase MltG [Bacilli bacterium]MDD4406727.1 endolytic transglycosylase MltG [Bacilli bacterium]